MDIKRTIELIVTSNLSAEELKLTTPQEKSLLEGLRKLTDEEKRKRIGELELNTALRLLECLNAVDEDSQNLVNYCKKLLVESEKDKFIIRIGDSEKGWQYCRVKKHKPKTGAFDFKDFKVPVLLAIRELNRMGIPYFNDEIQ